MTGVGRVEAAHYDHHVNCRRVVGDLIQSVLTFLCSIADGVHDHEMLVELVRAVLLHHGLLKHLAQLLCVTLEHGRLVGQPHTLKHGAWCKPSRDCILEHFHEFLLIASVENVVTHILPFLQVLDNDVVASEGGCGHSLLMRVLAMDDRCEQFLAVGVHGVPYLGHPGTSGVNHLHALVLEVFHFLGSGAKCWENDHIATGDGLVVLALPLDLLNNVDVQLNQALVDLWVVNDFICDEQLAVRERLASLIRHAHSALHAPAVAISFGQCDADLSLLPSVIVLTHLGNQTHGRVPHAMVLHQHLAILVVVGLPRIPARLIQGPPDCPSIQLRFLNVC
mmetsp:Transcript_19105/g.32795  ORF Transcript_19105/g.32795 Transcript_19105/m.32795 type:complete len:336 (-) Transcript_19105:170-1177(-)